MAKTTFTICIFGADGAFGRVHLYSAILLRDELSKQGVTLLINVCVRKPIYRTQLMSGEGWNDRGKFTSHNNLGVEFPDKVDMKGVTAYDSVQETLKTGADLAIIAVSTAFHREIAVQCADAQVKMIFVEKPLSLTGMDCDDLLTRCGSKGSTVLVGHELLNFDQHGWLAEAVREKQYGTLNRFNALREVNFDAPPAYRGNAEQFGNPVEDLGVHDAKAAIDLFESRPTEVLARGRSYGDGWVEYCDEALIWFEGGQVLTFRGGARFGSGFDHGYTAEFTGGTVMYNLTNRGDITAHVPGKGSSCIAVAGGRRAVDPILDEVRLAVQVARGEAEPGYLDGNSAALAVKTVNAISKSIVTGQSVQVSV